MIKAVFMDYTGTIISQGGEDAEKFVYRVCENSDMKNPNEFLKYWWGMIKSYEVKCKEDTYITGDEMLDQMLERCVNEIHLKDNLDELHILCQRFWMYAPIYSDVKEFFDYCPYPIYIISNNGIKYIEEAMKINGLSPAGIITADMVKACKPYPAIFEKALEISGCSADEVIHIGDSVESDVKGANAVQIKPVLIDRENKYTTIDVIRIEKLAEALNKI